MPTPTTNYGLSKPDVNNPSDQDIWGNELNDDMDELDGLLNVAINFTPSLKTANFSVSAPVSGSSDTGDANTLFRCNATSGAMVPTLPLAVDAGPGFTIAFKKTDATANAVTTTASGSDKIDGASSFALSVQYNWAILVSDGVSAWDIISDTASTTGFMLSANNLSDVANVATSRTNLGLTSVATANAKQLCKAWCYFDGSATGTNAPIAGYNVSSVTRNNSGDWTINFSSSLADANYTPVGVCSSHYGTQSQYLLVNEGPSGVESAPTINSCRCCSSGAFDSKYVSIQIFGN